MATTAENNDNVPQWKKDLIARLRSQNKKTQSSQQQQQQQRAGVPTGGGACGGASGAAEPAAAGTGGGGGAMVQERTWCRAPAADGLQVNGYGKDPDDPEELRYGPGIVHRLRDKYLSLALRETAARPTVLRKAASLEHLLEDDVDGEEGRRYEKKAPGAGGVQLRGRYRPRVEMKRARSVETISRLNEDEQQQQQQPQNNRQSLHEEVLLLNSRNDPQPPKASNRPKRLPPLVGGAEKPPADFVKEAKRLFERRPESRTKRPPANGEVAAKVEQFTSIIVKAKVASKKPPIKHSKPVIEKNRSNTQHSRPVAKPVIISEDKVKLNSKPKSLDVKPATNKKETSLPSPIPDVSRIERKSVEDSTSNNSSLSETPDLILTSSLVQNSTPVACKKQSLEAFIKEERKSSALFEEANGIPKILSPTKLKNGETKPSSPTFAFAKLPPTEPLRVEVNGYADKPPSSPRLSPRILQTARQLTEGREPSLVVEELTTTIDDDIVVVDEKRAVVVDRSVAVREKSVVMGRGGAVSEVINESVVVVPVKKPRRKSEETGAIVFNFTGRRDVPDYIANDTTRKPAKPEMPKPGEGGVILLPWAAAAAAAAGGARPPAARDGDDDEEEALLRSLEGPPSPCDVTFLNDNVLIDGRSSLADGRPKRSKLKISFVDAGPDVYEYPSEGSLLWDEAPASPAQHQQQQQLGHAVPNLSGSTLADYIPKTTDDFELGVTRRPPTSPLAPPAPPSDPDGPPVTLEEAHEPVTFSSGTNSDMLF